MKNLKQYIKEELTKLQEREYNAPPEVLDVVKNRLKVNPINRYVDYFKAVNSIRPSYEVFLHNGESFIIIYEDFSLMAKIGSKEYYLNDIDEKNYAIQHINRLLTGPKMKPGEGEEGDEEEADTGGGLPSLPPLPPPPPDEEPEPEPEPEA